MPTTKADLVRWFDNGKTMDAAYMVIRLHTPTGEDYPSTHDTAEEALKVLARPGKNRRVMEVYDLNANRDKQMAMYRCMALNPTDHAYETES